MRSALKLALVAGLIVIIGLASATEVILLESPGCTKCAAAQKVLDEIGQKEDLNITSYYYYTDEGHAIIKEKKVKGDIPAIIIGDRVISYKEYNGDTELLKRLLMEAIASQLPGSQNISTGFAQAALPSHDFNASNNGINAQNNNLSAQTGSELAQNLNLQELSLYSVAAVLGAGLVAGFNPCLLGILVFLAASVLSSNGRRRELMMMVVFFSLGIFTMYFLFGLGMQRLLQSEAVASLFRYVLTIFLLVIGLAHILDAEKLRRGGDSLFRTDWALKYFEAGVDKRRYTSYFLIGALFSLVKAPCVVAIYLAILDLISQKSYLEGAVYLAAYNLGVVLPILILGGFIAFGMSPARVDALRKDHRVTIRLLTGILLLALAPLIYWQVI
jgi:cytochrome c biogenesis protein CcdA/thiol-disulfide isomerase/thioredoxin